MASRSLSLKSSEHGWKRSARALEKDKDPTRTLAQWITPSMPPRHRGVECTCFCHGADFDEVELRPGTRGEHAFRRCATVGSHGGSHLQAAPEEAVDDVGADKAGGAGDENVAGVLLVVEQALV
jgi:hypothetical protein